MLPRISEERTRKEMIDPQFEKNGLVPGRPCRNQPRNSSFPTTLCGSAQARCKTRTFPHKRTYFMLNRLSSFLYRFSTSPVTLTALVIFLLFISLVMPKQSAQAKAYTRDAGSPDTSFFYSAGDLYRMAESYGEAGRLAYVYARLTFDVIFPLIYLFFLGTSLSWTLARVLTEGQRGRILNLFPLFGWLFDLLENLSTSIVMLNFPKQVSLAASLASVFTMLKWFFVGGSLVILVSALFIALWKRRLTR
jgi:hypothetical protein